MTKTLIAGCGDVGIRLANRLVRQGHEVWGIRRNVDNLPTAIHAISADLANSKSFPDLPPDLDHVVYCAAAGERSETRYRKTYVEGLNNLLHQLNQQSNKSIRIIFVSSTAVYAQHKGEWVDENSETNPGSFSGQILLEAEQMLASSGYRHTIVRLGGIYGLGRAHFISQVKNGELSVNEQYPQYTNRIHCEDCAAVLQHIMQLETPATCYVAVDNAPVSRTEVADWLATQLKVAKPLRDAPGAIPKSQNKRCKNSRLIESGYRFQYPSYREGYRAVISELKTPV
ncbi:MAG: SDR family oxidoreductase [Pseudomonadales bacterium]|nr:SDR family oxidoreductase [Pseudomonadales bacterium]